MPNIPFPDVPAYPGVPQIPRSVTASPVIALGVAPVLSVLANALQYPSPWGIYDSSGNLLGISDANPSLSQILTNQILGGSPSAIQSTISFDFLKEFRISDFPVEAGSFASYNKVQMPENPVVTISLSGNESDRQTFLNAIDAASNSLDFYFVNTPESVFGPYSIERYTYTRRASKGATLLTVEISLKEIRQVSASFSQSSPIVSPQTPSATAQVDTGITQTSTPNQSTLYSIMQALPGLIGAN